MVSVSLNKYSTFHHINIYQEKKGNSYLLIKKGSKAWKK
jgi:hypothetical protein